MGELDLCVYASFLSMLVIWVLAVFGHMSPWVHLIPEAVFIFLIGVRFGKEKDYLILILNIVLCIVIPFILARFWLSFVIAIFGVFASSGTVGFILGSRFNTRNLEPS